MFLFEESTQKAIQFIEVIKNTVLDIRAEAQSRIAEFEKADEEESFHSELESVIIDATWVDLSNQLSLCHSIVPRLDSVITTLTEHEIGDSLYDIASEMTLESIIYSIETRMIPGPIEASYEDPFEIIVPLLTEVISLVTSYLNYEPE